MDYHRYGSLGVGGVPPLLSGTALPEHAATASAPSALPGPTPAILSHHHHHPSLMFHYGVGGKALPPHLVSPVATSANNILGSSCSTTFTTHPGTISSLSGTPSKLHGTPSVRTTATVPPLGLGHSIPLTTTAGSGRPPSPSSSSFAAALRSLAKQATIPIVPEQDQHPDRSVPSSPKSIVSNSNSHGLVLPSAPPVVTIAPSHSHQTLSDLRKDPTVPASSGADVECLATSEDLMRGFQPYRAPDLPTVSSAGQLRPALPMDLAHPYGYPSLYSHHLGHQYRLEEQLYLERYGLMRPPLPPYGIGGLSSLYPSSPYLSTRFPPELLPTSLSALHPSSALLHERLKLEEDIRQREYELELRRERELEKEREKERGREREREKERDRRHKEYETEKNKEDRHKDIFRTRSPLMNSWVPQASSSNSHAKKSPVTGIPQQFVTGVSPQQPIPKPLESRTPKFSTEPLLSSSADTSHKSGKQRIPAIVRPFESTHSGPIAPIPPPVYSIIDRDSESDDSKTKETPEKKLANGPDPKPFSVWQPVQLNLPPKAESPRPASLRTPPLPTVIINGQTEVKTSSSQLPKHSEPRKNVADVVSSVPDIKSEVSVKIEDVSSEMTEKKPDVEVIQPVSRLDLEERRMKELKDSGLKDEEVEELLWEDDPAKTSPALREVPTLPLDVTEEKLSFLQNFELVTKKEADRATFDLHARRSETLNPLIEAMELDMEDPVPDHRSGPELASVLAPGVNLSELPRLKGANSLLSDFPRKSRFLNQLGLSPQYSKAKQKNIETIWRITLKDRLKHYEKLRGWDQVTSSIQTLLDKTSEAASPAIENQPPPTPPITHKLASMESILDASSQEVVNADQATQAAMQALHSSIASTSQSQVQNSLLDSSDKKMLEDRLLEVQNLISNQTESLLPSPMGIDKLMEHLSKNSPDGVNSTNLLKNMEEVRKYQLLVCQTAQSVQEQVAKLISTRSQLESHRCSLHAALSSISNLLKPNDPLLSTANTPVSTKESLIRQSFNISSLTSNLTTGSSSKTTQNVLTTSPKSSAAPVATSVSWSNLPGAFLSQPSTPDMKNSLFYQPIKEPKEMKPLYPTKSISRPKSSVITSYPKGDKSPRSLQKTISRSYDASPKVNGASSRILSGGVSVPNSQITPRTTSSHLSSSTLGSQHLYYVSTPSLSRSITSFPSTKPSVISHVGTNALKAQKPTKNPLSFTPYAKTSSKVPSWLPNN